MSPKQTECKLFFKFRSNYVAYLWPPSHQGAQPCPALPCPALPCPTLSPAGSDLTLGTLKLAQRVGKLAKYAIRERNEGERQCKKDRERERDDFNEQGKKSL